MPEFRLEMSAQLERRCRDWCRRWYPFEGYGFLLGTVSGDLVHVDEVWLPPVADAKRCFKKDRAFIDVSWVHDVEEVCDGLGVAVVGDFHSHPYLEDEMRAAPVPSDFDLDNAGEHAVFGICNVWPRADGRLGTRMRWWGPTIKMRRIDEQRKRNS